MRWIILVLVFTNIGYFAWGSFQESRSNYQIHPDSGKAVVETGRRLTLLSEKQTEPSAEKRKLARPTPKPKQQVSNDTTELCLALGPFQSPDLVDQVQQRLFSLGIESKERANKSKEAADYWVHIPPLASRDAAIRLLRELQAQKFDSFVITQGELANGISLGLFSKYNSAKSVRRRLIDAGYTVEIKTLTRQPESWWLELDGAAEEKLDNYFWDELVQRVPDIKKAKKSCKGIATVTEFL